MLMWLKNNWFEMLGNIINGFLMLVVLVVAPLCFFVKVFFLGVVEIPLLLWKVLVDFRYETPWRRWYIGLFPMYIFFGLYFVNPIYGITIALAIVYVIGFGEMMGKK